MQFEILHMLYDWPTWGIIVCLLVSMFVANELGFRGGQRNRESETELSRTVSNALKGSIFGLVALLLGFSFSATTNRYDLRQRLAVDNANAIGTCYLRAALLSDPSRDSIQNVLRRYVDLRLQNQESSTDQEQYARTEAINQLLNKLWIAVEEANRREPEKVRNSMLVAAANEVIDLSSTRSWANRNHLPNTVLILLLSSVIVSSLLLGHSSGQAGRRHFGLWCAINTVFALVFFIVLDFDRPKRGLIRVDQTSLIELRTSMNPQ